MLYPHKLVKPILVLGFASWGLLLMSTAVNGQVIRDNTLSTEVETTDNQNFTITGGTQKGNNLFHSFEQFSVPDGGSAFFETNTPNIFSRVTGGLVSDILGSIKTNSGVSLFLLNPQGIIIGANAQLTVGGSFVATTADSILFKDAEFSANPNQTELLLTVNVPIGLQFGTNSGNIISSANLLSVQPGKTLALIGTGLQIDGASELTEVKAPGGRIELGSVEDFSFVDLNPISQGWILGYEKVSDFQDIQISQAVVDTSDFSGILPNGSIKLKGRSISISNGTDLGGINFFNPNPGGNVVIDGSESVTITKGSIISTTPFLSGKAGDITIKTKRLFVDNGVLITSAVQVGNGQGGDLVINASESIDINGNGVLTRLTTGTDEDGNAGNVRLKTKNLTLRNGGQISSSTRGSGEGGNLFINVDESINITGQVEGFRKIEPSGLFAETTVFSEPVTGNGGNIEITTGSLNIQEGGRVSVGAVNGSQGRAGSLNINASNSVNINGSGSTLLAESESAKSAGNLDITTPKLTVANQGKVTVSATGAGEAGSLNINAQDIVFDRGTLTAETKAGNKGNITISNAETLLLRNNSKITTNATTEATGGNISITADAIAGLNNSDITANAQQGQAGKVTINASRGVIGLEVREQEDADSSDITATSDLGVDFNGEIIFNTPDVDPLNGLIELPTVPLDAEAIFAQNLCKFEDGKIAKGSSFIITGKGGITPTAENPLGDRDRVVNWANRDDLKVSKNGVVGVLQGSAPETLKTSDRILQQAQGWVITADGSVWLTADNPQTTLQNSGIVHPNCRNSIH